MKNRRIMVLCLLLVLCALTSCHSHSWVDATCTEPKTCSECGETEGEALGHDWIEATCTEPKTCSRCGETEGKATGHNVAQWDTVKESTCTEKGERAGKCTVCGQTVTEEIKLAAHTPGDWTVEKEATYSEAGMRVKKCTVCGEIVDSETFELSAEEKETWYKSQCVSIGYDELARNPDAYKGTKIYITGEVIQVMDSSGTAHYRINTGTASWGWSGDTVYVEYKLSGSRILEDDVVTVYGEYYGLYSYESVMGASVTIPAIIAEYVEVN